MRWRILALLLLIVSAPARAGETPSSESPFVSAIASYARGNYAGALSDLERAYETAPAVRDYVLLYMAKSYLQTGGISNAIDSARKLIESHPGSPLIEEARGLEAMAALQGNRKEALELLRLYSRDYPSDMGMKFVLAGLLKDSGSTGEAKALFKEIYVAACPYSRDAWEELEPEDITAADLLARAVNLRRNGLHGEAEKILRAALGRGDAAALKRDITEQLALSLFSQKKYAEASPLLLEVGDLYNAARSYLRSGSPREFEDLMKRLASSADPKGARLMIAYSGELRRSGRSDDALALLESAMKIYPDAEEDALWSAGWIRYLRGESGRARETFSKLYAKYKNPKYLYWQARASEKDGNDAAGLYEKLDGDDFYGIMARLRAGGLNPAARKGGTAELPKPGRMERVDLLVDAGLKDYAVRELIMLAERKSDYTTLGEVAAKLLELQEYRRAMLVTSTLPGEMRPAEILYPLAFWSRVTSAASDYGMDPYLLLSVIREESRFDPDALSPAGAVGLMQLMPQTARVTAGRLQISVEGPRSLRDADLNIRLGAHYLSGLMKQFGSVPAALAAYNAGGARVRQWLSERNYESADEFIEDIPFLETRNYVKRIVASYYHYRMARTPGEEAGLGIF